MSLSPSKTLSSIHRYSQYLKEGRKVEHAFKRLSNIQMTADLLKQTGVKEAIRIFDNDENYNGIVRELVCRWDEVNRLESQKEKTPNNQENRKRSSECDERENEIKKMKPDADPPLPRLKLIIKRGSPHSLSSPESEITVEKKESSEESKTADPKRVLEKVKSGVVGINRATSGGKMSTPVNGKKVGFLMKKTMKMSGMERMKKRS